MPAFVYSRNLVRKTPENVRDVQAMFMEVRDYLNGAKLTGTDNFADDSIGPGKVAYNAVNLPQLNVGTLGFSPNAVSGVGAPLGNIITSRTETIEIGPLSGVSSSSGSFSLRGMQPGDIVLLHRAWSMVSGNYSNMQLGMFYLDNVGSDSMPRVALDFGTHGYDDITNNVRTLGAFAMRAQDTGASVGIDVLNTFGTQIISVRLTALVLRLT